MTVILTGQNRSDGEFHGGRPRPTGAVVPMKKKKIQKRDEVSKNADKNKFYYNAWHVELSHVFVLTAVTYPHALPALCCSACVNKPQ
jgi:hypothetical protein